MKRRAGLDLLLVPPRVEAALWRRLRFESETACRAAIFDRYRGLARAIAIRQLRTRSRNGIDQADLEQFAYEGLLQAIDRYDPLRGFPFGAFARPRIQGSIVNGAALLSEREAQYSSRRRVESERLRSLRKGGDVDEPLAALSVLITDLAIGLILEGTGIYTHSDTPDHRPNAYESLAWREMEVMLAAAVAQLPEKQGFVVRQHYLHGVAFAQIGQLLGITKGRVSQLHRSALEQLRAHIISRG